MARILVISRKKDEGRGLARLLWRDGHRTDLARAETVLLRMVLSRRPDLLVIAVPDPTATLRVVAKALGSRIRQMPAIAIFPEGSDSQVPADAPGLMDPLTAPFSDETFLARVDALLRVRDVLYQNSVGSGEADAAFGPGDVPARASGWRGLLARIGAWSGRRRPLGARPLEPYLQTTASLVSTVEGRDAFDPGHGGRVAAHCAAIATVLGMDGEETERLLQAAAVHDIGKIGLSAELLGKPELTERDRNLVKTHPRRGAQLLKALTPYGDAAQVILCHHERPDGQGYYGLPAEQVPLSALVLSVADVFDGMTSSRTGRPPITPSEALEALRAGSGTAYDADCVEALAFAVRPRRRTVPLSTVPIPGR